MHVSGRNKLGLLSSSFVVVGHSVSVNQPRLSSVWDGLQTRWNSHLALRVCLEAEISRDSPAPHHRVDGRQRTQDDIVPLALRLLTLP